MRYALVLAIAVLPAAHAVAQQPAVARSGELVTRVAGREIGRERFTDDGHALTSQITLAGRSATATIARRPAHLRLEANGQTLDRDLDAHTLALPNGQWQAYAIAAERFPHAIATPVRVDVGQSETVAATLTVRADADGTRQVTVVLGPLEVHATVSPAGLVTAADVPAQGVLVAPAGTASTDAPPAPRPPPPGVTEERFETTRGGVALRGVLWRLPVRDPGRGAAPALVVIIAGSGPTDRDGNSALGLQTDVYRKIAEALAAAGIWSLRYDKRGVGASGRNFDPAALTLDDFVADAAAVVAHARTLSSFRSVTVLGHSEGGLIALELARTAPPDALILVATPGRPMAALLREQLNRAHDAATGTAVDAALDAIRHSRPLPDPNAPFAPLFAPVAQRFLRSELDVDPAPLFHAQHVPTTIVQGETDAQVTVADARALAAARPDAHVVILPRVNHVLCEEASSALPQASYLDPTRPLVAAAVRAIIGGVAPSTNHGR